MSTSVLPLNALPAVRKAALERAIANRFNNVLPDEAEHRAFEESLKRHYAAYEDPEDRIGHACRFANVFVEMGMQCFVEKIDEGATDAEMRKNIRGALSELFHNVADADQVAEKLFALVQAWHAKLLLSRKNG